MGDKGTLNVKNPFTSQDDFPPPKMAFLSAIIEKSEW
jgi:hypothetical protein